MSILKFTVSGDYAFFKTPESYLKLKSESIISFGQIHVPAIKGLLGAVMGFEGLSKAYREQTSIEFMDKFEGIRLGYKSNSSTIFFDTFYETISNTTGFANNGSNYLLVRQLLSNVSWNIYLDEDSFTDNELFQTLSEKLINQRSTYPLKLGKNSLSAKISGVELIEKELSTETIISSFVPETYIVETTENDMSWLDTTSEIETTYLEKLPIDYNQDKLYIYDTLICTNQALETTQELLKIKDNDLTIALF